MFVDYDDDGNAILDDDDDGDEEIDWSFENVMNNGETKTDE